MDASPALRLRKSGHVSTTVHLCSLRYLAFGPFHRSLLQHRIWTTWTGEVAKHQQRELVQIYRAGGLVVPAVVTVADSVKAVIAASVSLAAGH